MRNEHHRAKEQMLLGDIRIETECHNQEHIERHRGGDVERECSTIHRVGVHHHCEGVVVMTNVAPQQKGGQSVQVTPDQHLVQQFSVNCEHVTRGRAQNAKEDANAHKVVYAKTVGQEEVAVHNDQFQQCP